MNEREIFNAIIATWLTLAAIVFVLLFFITAPYGRYVRKGWGATINNKMGWIIMESTSSLLFALFFILGNRRFICGTHLPGHVGSPLHSPRIYLSADPER